jgi:hypothetical protein
MEREKKIYGSSSFRVHTHNPHSELTRSVRPGSQDSPLRYTNTKRPSQHFGPSSRVRSISPIEGWHSLTVPMVDFIAAHPQYIAHDNALGFLTDNGGDTYNLCHCEFPSHRPHRGSGRIPTDRLAAFWKSGAISRSQIWISGAEKRIPRSSTTSIRTEGSITRFVNPKPDSTFPIAHPS